MTFNTGNPIGSTDARDLSDNAENFDKALGTLDATWTDRLGVTRDSFEGRLAKGSFYRVGDFATGYTLTNMRQTLEYSGHEYSWAGAFPKVVAAGATPATSGGIGAGAWVDRTDDTLRSDLAEALTTSRNGKLATKDFVTITPYLSGDETDHTAALQNAVNDTPFGGKLIIPDYLGVLTVGDVVIDKPITIEGPSSAYFTTQDTRPKIKAASNTSKGFILTATVSSYLFGQYGITGVNFNNLSFEGYSNSDRSASAVCCDTSVNSGNYHVRGISMHNVSYKYYRKGVDLEGACYLNDFYNIRGSYCDDAFYIKKTSTSDGTGQTRLFGCEFTLNTNCFKADPAGSGGDYQLFGCTLSESVLGAIFDEEATFLLSGCTLESNSKAAVYIPIQEANPNSSASRTIVGNKFITNTDDIWIDKQTTAFSGGGFSFAGLVDSNAFSSTVNEYLKVTVPTGHTGLDSMQFVFGASNTGTNGVIDTTKISSLFLGQVLYGMDFNQVKKDVLNQYKSFNYAGGSSSNQLVDVISLADTYTIDFKKIHRRSFDSTGVVGSSSFIVKVKETGTVLFSDFGSSDISLLSHKNTSGATETLLVYVNNGGTAANAAVCNFGYKIYAV